MDTIIKPFRRSLFVCSITLNYRRIKCYLITLLLTPLAPTHPHQRVDKWATINFTRSQLQLTYVINLILQCPLPGHLPQTLSALLRQMLQPFRSPVHLAEDRHRLRQTNSNVIAIVVDHSHSSSVQQLRPLLQSRNRSRTLAPQSLQLGVHQCTAECAVLGMQLATRRHSLRGGGRKEGK